MIHYVIVLAVLAVFVVLLIGAEFAERRKLIYVYKPVSSALLAVILFLSLSRPGCFRAEYTLALMAGMFLSLCGDVALMFKSRTAFRTGLVLFIFAHIVYAAVFTRFNGFWPHDWISGIVLVLLGVAVYVYLLPGLKNMKAPVLVYLVVISVMVNRAASAFFGHYFTPLQAFLITTGAGLFYVSDVILAAAAYRLHFRYHRISLAFYYSGQALIMISAGYFCAV